MRIPSFRKGYCTGVDDFYYRKNAFSIWKMTLTQGENAFSFFATIFTQGKNAFSICKSTPTQGEYTFSFFATIFTLSQQWTPKAHANYSLTSRKGAKIRKVYSAWSFLSTFIFQRSPQNFRTSERGISSELLSFIFQRSSLIFHLSFALLCVFAWANPAQT